MEEDERSWNIAYKEEMRNSYKLAVGEPERMKPFVRFRYIWEDSIKMEIEYEGRNSFKLVWNMV
jgi:hypothetical protein